MIRPRSDIFIVIAAYNEEKSIASVLEGLQALPYQVVVVNDGSRDRTAEIALEYPVILLEHLTNLGQGAGLQTGVAYALTFPQTRAVVTFDADGQHEPQDIDRLLAPVLSGAADVALGTRFGPGAKVIDIPPTRRLGLKLATLFTLVTTGLRLTDTHNGMRAFSAEAARKIRITYNRMAHASEILMEIRTHKLRYTEVPVTVRYTAYSLEKGQGMLDFINILWDMISGSMK